MTPRSFTILFRDADLVVVAKAAGISVMRAREDDRGDLIARVAHELGVAASNLAVHQRLDRDTSGVMVFACSSRGNEILQQAFADREALCKEYVAVIERRIPLGMMRHMLVHDDGVTECYDQSRDPRALPAETEVLALEPLNGERFLARLRIYTGRTHQIRAQLAHVGAPIVGDRIYGGTRHLRLLLHAERLTFRDKTSGKTHEFAAPTPTDFAEESLVAALRHAVVRRSFLARTQTNTYRLLHESETSSEHLAIDDYAGHWVVHNYADDKDVARLWAQTLWQEAQSWDSSARPESLFLKHRPRGAHRLREEEKGDWVESGPLFGACPEKVVARENDIAFVIRPADGLSAGLFLDQRDNRAWLKVQSPGKRVLNLFSYTCGFSLAAWEGGAKLVTSVDMSKRLLAWGAENFAENPARPVDPALVKFVHEDVFAFLQRNARRNVVFDRIVVDPPTFATTKTSRFTSGKDWQKLFAAVLGVASDHAVILATSNDRRMHQQEFRFHLHKALDGRSARVVDVSEPRDFPSAPWFAPHLKAVRVELL